MERSVVIVADGHYFQDAKGDVYCESVFDYAFYSRYLEIFDKVYAIGRIACVRQIPCGKRRADGPGVEFLPLPPGRGMKSFVANWLKSRRLMARYIERASCSIIRMPGVVANQYYPLCRNSNRAYGIEVVVDPYEYFCKGASGGPLRPIIRKLWTKHLKRACRESDFVSYVTEGYLQHHYPCRAVLNEGCGFTESYSSVEIADESIAKPRRYGNLNPIKIVHVANAFNGNTKGHVTLLRAIELLTDEGVDVRVTFIGDGPSRTDYESFAKMHGLESRVRFTGRLPGVKEVRDEIRKADIFVFPTRAEGLPRVLIEAMAEGLPCLSSPVCGIPEILEERYLISPDDSRGYARTIAKLAKSPRELERMSACNVETAARFERSKLQAKRNAFYSKILESSNEGRTEV